MLCERYGNALEGSGCVVFESNMKVKVEESGLYPYPDVTVACEQQRFVDDETDVLLNPTLIVEVLSESTEKYDRGRKKFQHYQRIVSLKEYILVSQNTPRVELWCARRMGPGRLHQAEGMEAKITPSPTLGVALEFREEDFCECGRSSRGGLGDDKRTRWVRGLAPRP